MNPLIEFIEIKKSFSGKVILNEINLKVLKGESLVIIGQSGSGKSVLLKCLLGVLRPNFGKIIIENSNVTNLPIYIRAKKFKIGYVPQYGGYFHDLSLIDNLKAIGEILIKDDRERYSKIHNLISKFTLDNVQEVKAKFLSGGQKRKLVICMALLGDPKILLCDEIFAALDVLTIHMLKEILVNLQHEKPNMAIVICEHQARELLSIVDRALILSNCKIIAEGSPNKLIKDENAKSQYFGNFFTN